MSEMARAASNPLRPPSSDSHARKVGSASSAMRCTSIHALSHGDTRGAVAMKAALRMRSPSMIAHSRAWKPPMELPMSKSTYSMPKCSRTKVKRRAVSRTVNFGKDNGLFRSPESGLQKSLGPVVP